MAVEIIAYHHEKYDGSGYPDGLAGEDIPLSARVVALADVYDAISSKRVYKSAFPREECRRIILEGSGPHFDPRLVDIFNRVEPAFWKVTERLRDRATI
jgi:putative two-component system response regulator